MALANFAQAAALGTESGKSMGSMNPLGQFVRNMMDAYKQRQEFESKAGLVGLQSLFSTQEDLGKEQRAQGYQIQEEQRKQESPLYKAQVDAEQKLAQVRQNDLSGDLTPEKAFKIISVMDRRQINALKAENPQLWETLTQMALGGQAAAPQEPDINAMSQEDLLNYYLKPSKK